MTMRASSLRYALADPIAAWNYLLKGRKGVNLLGLKRFSKATNVPFERIADSINEITRRHYREEVFSSLHGFNYIGWINFPETLYAIVKCSRPKVMVETGVAAGISSSFILRAMEDVKYGDLYSIDLPNFELDYFPKMGLQPVSILPEGKTTGFAIPTSLKHRWHLTLGKSGDTLSQLLEDLGEIDCFLHDSEHTYENMMFEFQTAWKNLRAGGLLLCDNSLENSAFVNFARSVHTKPILLYFSGMGCIVK